jgi:TolA-binding protein
MTRWLLAFAAIVLGAAAGVIVGYWQWGTQTAHVERVEQRLAAVKSEAANEHAQAEQLEQRLQQVLKEQERLAQENEILRKQQTTERLLGGAPGELPALPPK